VEISEEPAGMDGNGEEENEDQREGYHALPVSGWTGTVVRRQGEGLEMRVQQGEDLQPCGVVSA